MCASDDLCCLLLNPLVESSSTPCLLKTRLDNSPPVASYFCPDTSSTASDVCSQCSPVPIRSCGDSPHKNSHSRRTTRSPDAFVGVTVWNRDEGAFPWVYVWGLSFVTELSVGGSIPKSSVSPCIRWDNLIWCSACRTAYICPRPSVEFCAASHSWV